MDSLYKIVVIDDELGILELYESFIPSDKYEVVKFEEPVKALEFILKEQNNIAFIISDLKMPEMDGFTLREKMLSEGVDIPFAMITGFYDKEMATKAMKLRICEFLEKPVHEEKVLELIENEASQRIESLEEDREMISEFLNETKPMLEEIEDLILSLEDDPHDERAVNTYFRLLHTIKGTSSCLGLTEISNYAHSYEDLITSVKDHVIGVNKDVINALLTGLDQLKELYSLAESFQPFPTDLEERAKIFSQDFSAVAKEVVSEDTSGQIQVEKKEKTKDKDEKVSVSEGLLAEFLEMSGELTVIRNSIFKCLTKIQEKLPGDHDVEHLDESLVEMQKVSGILQNQIAEMKKVSIESVYRPMRRVVRDSCSVLSKDVNFEIEGENLKIDTTVAKLLNGALVHLLRNGVDHGIEDKATRIESGKPEQGNLTLRSYETGEDIIVEIVDDGKGLDKEMLKRKAIEKELYTEEELAHMSDQKIYSIIFESGFSTNTEVTSVSGRGVGMDMVKSSIEEFGGKILIDSEVGRGSKFVLVIPIPRSILIIKSLMVLSGHQKFNIPVDDVDEVVLFDKNKADQSIYRNNGGLILKHHDKLCPLISLNKTLNLGDEEKDFTHQNIVIVKGEGFRYGIMVDAILDIEEIVVKKLSQHFEIGEYLGTTFADDGELSMILDCKGISARYKIENELDEEDGHFLTRSQESIEKREYMRFSLKNAENCALPLDMVFRLEEVATKEIQFTGSRGLVRYRGSSLPLISVEFELGLNDQSLFDLSKSEEMISVLVVQIQGKLYGAIIEELQDIATTQEQVQECFSDRVGIAGTVVIEEKIVSVVDIESLIHNKKGTLNFNNIEKNVA